MTYKELKSPCLWVGKHEVVKERHIKKIEKSCLWVKWQEKYLVVAEKSSGRAYKLAMKSDL